ncbi:MAG: TIGR04283 family arsenosugar biosynthesis glycosyltransferase [Pseudomonadales bacterium]|nr:TIGR04283 family arsenosugar biosynthesis glycosyltransferase [Pseudomonadales bacterium]
MATTTVIIPVLNEAPHIEKLLAPLTGIDVIIVDGGSTDNTLALLTAFKAKVIQGSTGRARQMNAGAAEATGDILIFLHADTRLPEGWQNNLRDFADSKKVWGRFNLQFDETTPAFSVLAFMMNWRSRLTGICTGDQAIFVRRSAFDKLNGFADIPLMEDIDISRRLRRESWPHCVPDKATTSARRWRARGLIRTVLHMWWYRLQYFFGVSPERLVKSYYS